MSAFCAAESPARFPKVINTTFGEKTYIRWCCNDRLSSHALPDMSARVAGHAIRHDALGMAHPFRWFRAPSNV